MRKTKIFTGCLAFVLCMGMWSCGGDDPLPTNPGDPGDPEVPETPDTTGVATMTPQEAKIKLESVATAFLGKIKASDQEKVIKLLSYFVDNYGVMEDDEPMEPSPEYPNYSKSILRNTVSAITDGVKGDAVSALSLSKAVRTKDEFKIEDSFGVFEYVDQEWTKVADSNGIIFRFKDAQGKTCTMELTPTGNTRLETEDEIINIPTKMTAVLTQGNDQLLSAQVTNKIVLGSEIKADVQLTMGGYSLSVVSNVSPDVAALEANVVVNNENLIKVNVALKGNNLTGQNMPILNENIFEGIKAGEGSMIVNVMNNAFVLRTRISDCEKFFAEADDVDFDKQTDAVAKAKILNDLLSRADFTLSKQNAGSIVWKEHKYEYTPTYSAWDVQPVLKFGDNTMYEFDQYFDEASFSSVTSLAKALENDIKALWGN